ncbi:MAG: GNAT family N-acetyltransferase [Oceanidesulfovibrio sp.]
MQTHDTVTLRLPATCRHVGLVAAVVTEYAAKHGYAGIDAQRLSQAAEEAVLHAIRFGYGAEDDTLDIEISTTALGLQLAIRSKGLPLKEDMLPQYDPERLAAEGDVTGLDAFMIRKLMDSARFTLSPDGVREIVMLKHPPLPIHEQAEQPVTRAVPSGSKDDRLAIRFARPEDAEGISRLVMRAHGSLLFSEDIYYPARVREMIETAEMVSMVAVTEDGVLAAHGALVSEGPGAKVEELTYGFTAPEYRGNGSARELADKLLENARSRGVEAVYASAVTNHDKSQRAAHHVGLRESALFLGVSPASRAWQTKNGHAPGRISDLAMVYRLQKTDDLVVYAPPRHQRMIETIHANLGLRMRYEHSRVAPHRNEARVEALSDVKDGWATLFVTQYGRDVVSLVESHVRLLCTQGVKAVQLVLPMTSPAVCALTDAFESRGFFFSGAMPDRDGHDALVLQQLNGIDPDYDSIRTYSPAGRELLEYVRSCDFG